MATTTDHQVKPSHGNKTSPQLTAPMSISLHLPTKHFCPLNLEDSPVSSPPSDTELTNPSDELYYNSINSKQSVLINNHSLPAGVRLPQRKGGMHLWQFLYSILQAPEKYSYLVEWTANKREFEFRLLEPDAIAVWWGYHKNRKNMSYDKLSRSLRYYYDKRIIKKIGGERYVYQFCVDPEVMYAAIGNSENRPQLKPIPESAEKMLIKNQQARAGHEHLSSPSLVVEDPESLSLGHNRRKRSASFSPVQALVPGFHYPGVPNFVTENDYQTYSSSREERLTSPSPKRWHSQESNPATSSYDGYQEPNFFYPIYQNSTESMSLLPTDVYITDSVTTCSTTNPQYIAYDDHLNTVTCPTSLPTAVPNNFSEANLPCTSSYYSSTPHFSMETATESEFTNLPQTVTSIAMCGEFAPIYSSLLPNLVHDEVQDFNGVPFYDETFCIPTNWSMVGSDAISTDFNAW